MIQKFFILLSAVSFGLAVATCFLWARGTSGVDEATLTYDRYLADGRAASTGVYLTSDKRLWINIMGGSVAPYNGQLVFGYHVNADKSNGIPRVGCGRTQYATRVFSSDGRLPKDDHAMFGWGPLRWNDFRRSGNTEEFRSFTMGVSHWMILILLLVLPLRRLQLLYRARQTKAFQNTKGEQSEAHRAEMAFGIFPTFKSARAISVRRSQTFGH